MPSERHGQPRKTGTCSSQYAIPMWQAFVVAMLTWSQAWSRSPALEWSLPRRRWPWAKTGLAWLAGTLVLVLTNAAAAKPANPGVEMKFFLDPSKTLDATGQLTPAVRAEFRATGPPVSIKMQFLDGPGLELHKAGWNVRFRTVGGENELELTYKRRYPVPSGLEVALKRAERDGFDDNEKDAEVEWGYQQRTLTFSNGPKPLPNTPLPRLADARARAVSNVPGKLEPEPWAKGILSGARLYGPVEGRRWNGHHDDIDDKIYIEVWVLPGPCRQGPERIVEVSFKKDDRDKAEEKREVLLELLERRGWLLPRDVLKTSLILERVPAQNQ